VLSACTQGRKVSATPAVEVSTPVKAFQHQLVRVVRAVSPSVVQIETSAGLGSGVVYDGKGNIVTQSRRSPIS